MDSGWTQAEPNWALGQFGTRPNLFKFDRELACYRFFFIKDSLLTILHSFHNFFYKNQNLKKNRKQLQMRNSGNKKSLNEKLL